MATCRIFETKYIFAGRKWQMGMTEWSYMEEDTPMRPLVDCPLHAFLVTNRFLYVPNGFPVFVIRDGQSRSPRAVNTAVAASDSVIRVTPEGYAVCPRRGWRFTAIKVTQPPRHITMADIAGGYWKLKGRRVVLKHTVDMLDGGVYSPDGVMVKEHVNMFMDEHFTIGGPNITHA